MGKVTRTITDTGVIRALAIDGTDIVREARRIHQTTPVATAALGRALMAASLMGSMLKSEKESLTLRIAGGGPLGKVFAAAEADGFVRGFVENPGVELPLRGDGKLDVGRAVGREGYLAVSKDLGTSEPYISQVPLVSGEIAEDVTSYFSVSEQTGTACMLGVLVGGDGAVRAAGGALLQLLPNVYEEEIARLEQCVGSAPPITELMNSGLTAAGALARIMESFTLETLDEAEVGYRCLCGTARVEKALIALGRGELFRLAVELHDKGESHLSVGCEFCDKKYRAWFEDGNVVVTQE